MSEVFKYIFNNMERTEKLLRKQARVNRNVTILAIVATVCLCYQAKKIDELDYEVHKIKRDMASREVE